MNWSAVEAITAMACAAAAMISGYSALTVKAAMEKLRADLAESRAKDRDELRSWINGSFLRAKVVEAELAGVDMRLSRLESDVWRKAS